MRPILRRLSCKSLVFWFFGIFHLIIQSILLFCLFCLFFFIFLNALFRFRLCWFISFIFMFEKTKNDTFHTKNLMRHMRYECGLPPRFPCHVCGRFFRRKDDLQRHIARIHGILDGAAAMLLAGDGIKQDEWWQKKSYANYIDKTINKKFKKKKKIKNGNNNNNNDWKKRKPLVPSFALTQCLKKLRIRLNFPLPFSK